MALSASQTEPPTASPTASPTDSATPTVTVTVEPTGPSPVELDANQFGALAGCGLVAVLLLAALVARSVRR
jgi:hypothetical protein